MSATDHDRATRDPKFAPSLNLNEIRVTVGSLNERELDVLSVILESDAAICKESGTDRQHLEQYLSKIYTKLGINDTLPSHEKRRAAELMDQIFSRDGWRPKPQEAAFLLRARDKTASAPARPASPPRASEASREPAVQPPAVTVPAAQTEPLPTVDEVAKKITDLSPWKLLLLDGIREGLTEQEQLAKLQETDNSADLSSVQSNLKKLYKSLGVRAAFEDGRARALVLQAYALYLQGMPTGSPAVPGAGTAAGEAADREVDTAPPADPSLAPIVARIALQVSEGAVSDRAMEILDALVAHQTVAAAADALGTTKPNVQLVVYNMREKFEIPVGNAESVKGRAAEERSVLIAAWRLYRQGNTVTDDGDTPEAAPAPDPETTPPVASAPAPDVLGSDHADDAGPLSHETAHEPDVPEEIVDDHPLIPEAPLPEPGGAAPQDALPSDTAPVADPAPEQAREAQAPDPSVPAMTSRVMPVQDGVALLHHPSSITGVRMLWSNAPAFEADQASAVAEGYRIERVDHLATFHPEFRAVSVVVLVKRS